MTNTAPSRRGLLLGIGAYGSWGLIPLYFKAVKHVAPMELLAHRAVWSFIVLAILTRVLGRWHDLRRDLSNPRTLGLLVLSTLLIAGNWLLFLHAVISGQLLQSSLGYFINPLVNVLLGVLVFRERLRPMQIVCIAIAAASVLWLARSVDQFPWLAVSLAVSFAVYALLRKLMPVDGLISLTAETAMLMPIGIVYLAWLLGTSRATGNSPPTLGLLMLSGLVTTIPLLLFGGAARRLPLSTLGILQYLAPTLQFLLAVAVFREKLTSATLVSFSGIWVAIAIYAADSIRAHRATAMSVVEPD